MSLRAGSRNPRPGLFASLLLAGLSFWLIAGPVLAATQVVEGGQLRLHYKNAALKSIAEDIARALGETIIIEPGMAGRFTITINHPISRSEALAVLEASLIMQGRALLVGDDGALKVLQVKDAADGSRWAGPLSIEEDRNKLVTTMLALDVGSASQVAAQMQHLVSKQDILVAYEATNSLIMVGTERRVRRMLELGQALDAGGQDELWVRTLRHRAALDTAEMLREALRPASEAEAGFRKEEEARIWADERTNTVLVMGSDSQLERSRAFISEIDQPLGMDNRVQVVRIYHRDAVELQKLLVTQAFGRAVGFDQTGRDLLGEPFMAVAHEATNSIVIDADPNTFQSILELIAALDRPKPRIQVDVTVYEITHPSRLRLGVDWFLPVLEPNSDGTGSVMTLSSNPSGGGLRGEIGEDLTFFGRVSRDPLLIPFTDSSGNVVDLVLPRETAVVTAESREVTTRALMQPSLLMTSGEEQRLFAGQNVPILVGQPQEALSPIQTASEVERQDVGVELRATARTGEDGDVELDLLIEISRVSLSPAGSVEQVGPTLDARRLETSLRLSDGELAVIGMSQDAAEMKNSRSTPFLQDIPVLGHLMRTQGTTRVDTHVIFAVQAQILKSREEDVAESLIQRMAMERRLSRVTGIRRTPMAPYAVLVTTRRDREAAQLLADSFERDGLRAQVGAWADSNGVLLYDVYLTGYSQLADAGFDSFLMQDRGFRPQVVVLPGELAVAKPPALRMLGSAPGMPESVP